MTDSVWALPFSLAATNGISIDFSSSSYSDASLRTVRPPRRKQGSIIERPHSEILGSTVACTYPRLIAACHVLHRLSSRVIHQPASLHQIHFASRICIVTLASKVLKLYANIVKLSIFYCIYHHLTSVVIIAIA